MTTKSHVKGISDALFSNRPAQTFVRTAAHRGLLPRAIYQRIRPTGSHPITTPGGNEVVYTAGGVDTMSRHMVWPSDWERSSLSLFSVLASKSELVMDVGAFAGAYTLVALGDSDARVISIEPNPHILPNLKRNRMLNDPTGRCEIIQAAVSDRSGIANLSIPLDPTMASLTGDVGGESVQVRMVTLDEVAAGRRVDLIKLDVENVEEAALRGATGILTESKPDLIVEILTPEAFDAVASFLRTYGYGSVRHLGAAGAVAVTEHIFEPKNFNFHFVSPR